MQLTALGYALIGLVIGEPRSGYALRKVFELTPMGAYSSSPGSIYPALNKLVKAGLLEQRAPAAGGKKKFHATPHGVREMNDWLRTPVTQEEVAKSIDLPLLKFAFLPMADDVRVTREFLSGFEAAVRAHIESLESYLTGPEGQSLSPHGRLAVENGLLGYKAHVDWAMRASEAFK